MHHALNDLVRLVNPAMHSNYLLVRAFASPGPVERAKYVFNDLIKNTYGPELLPRKFEAAEAATRLTERQ